MPGPGAPGPLGAAADTGEVENLLLRFIDCDVEPGITYEYRIRVRVSNPNFGQEKLVTNPEFAKKEILRSPWLQIAEPITVPPEAFLFAYDPAKYREDIDKAHKGNRAMLNLLQAKDNQAVVEVQTWMGGVKLSADTKPEPVGAWVVAEMPVGRGDFVGKKQFVKLPLWDSAEMKYQLRELPAEILKLRSGAKAKDQPHGWLVDFSSRDVLVDFEGGRVKAPKPGGGTIEEDAAVEMLIVRADGTAVVHNSAADMDDRERRERNQVWDAWLKGVEGRKMAPGVGPGGEGAPGRPGGPGGP